MGTSETSLRSYNPNNKVEPSPATSPSDTGSLLTGGKRHTKRAHLKTHRRKSTRVRAKHMGHSRHKKTMKGGFMSVIREALVPFGILMLQKRSQRSNTHNVVMNKSRKFRKTNKQH